MVNKRPHRKAIIGRSELINIINPDIADIPTKIDSGAFRSAIHATNVKIKSADGKKILTCELLGHPAYPESIAFETEKFGKVWVQNSFGVRAQRYEVQLKLKVGSKIFLTPFTLADRANNLFPILLGRKALKDRFIVDVSEVGVDRLKLKKKNKITIIEEEDSE